MTEFERCWPFLESALATYGNTHGKADIWNLIVSGRAQLWPMRRSSMLTEIIKYPTGFKTGNAWLAAGDLAEIMEWRPRIEEWAKSNNCNRAVMRVRPGWERVLKGYGYRRLAVELAKDL